MFATLVYDGSTVRVPGAMGAAAHGQLEGTPLEQLSELCSRVCYDSLGAGRSSAALHAHILEVRHLSVYRHAVMTVGFPVGSTNEAMTAVQTLLNRKGVWLEMSPDWKTLEVTINLQALTEWDRYSAGINAQISSMARGVGDLLRWHAHRLAPMIVPPPECDDAFVGNTFVKTTGLTADQAHVSLFLSGSRGFSHEQIRHNYAVSQRSTRYVDEDGSPYVTHPLTAAYLASGHPGVNLCKAAIEQSVGGDRKTYKALVAYLEEWLRAKGADRLTARKQARGAARGYLGNALTTELIFTAPVSGWKDMLRQRASKFADAEIRAIYAPVLRALQGSRYGGFFESLGLEPSPDGLGEVLAAS